MPVLGRRGLTSVSVGPATVRCGIHAFKSERLALRGAPTPRDGYLVRGTVALWGSVVEHDLGYRAEHAIIPRIIVPRRVGVQYSCGLCIPEVLLADISVDELPGPPLVEAVERRYGVDVELGEEIEIAV